MTGTKVERKGGKWFVDGKPFKLPKQKEQHDKSDAVRETVVTGDKNVFGNGCRHIDVVGLANIGCEMENVGITNVFNRISSSTSSGRNVVVKGGSVNIRRGGKKYTITGDNIEKRNGQWYADGKPVDWNDLGGKYNESNVVHIEINGTVQKLNTTSGDVTVNGTVTNIHTGSGDVCCESATSVNTGSGDVHCKHITGMVSTGSGDIYR